MDLSRLIEALSDPAAYPDPVEHVELRQTHISVVFLAGPHVYKIKKPVNPGFLDFTTLEKRRRFCDEEVRLNRRLAPQVYRGVVPVARAGSRLCLEGPGEVVEWAVKMERLPESTTLLERLRRGEATPELVQLLARRVAAFHASAETNERTAAFGRFESVARLIRDVFTLAAPQAGGPVSRAVFDRTVGLTEEALDCLRPLIEGRAARGLTRDCHGDLHLDHVYYFPDRAPPADLVIIDCIEFNERFRCIDPVADMAFVVMDLVFAGRRDLARAFAEAYFTATGDAEGRALLPLYTAYRAAVRGAVEGLLAEEKEVPQAERMAALERARAHWLLALAELEVPDRKPCLVLVAGLPGTGKSSLARGLAAAAGFVVLRTDAVRKELAGRAAETPTPPELRELLYSPEATRATYTECLLRAEQLLGAGQRVVVDATFHEEDRRRIFLDAAVRMGVPAVLFVCQTRPETARRRLEARRADASDADWSVHQQLAARWEVYGPETQRAVHLIDAAGSPEQVLSRALAVLREDGLFS